MFPSTAAFYADATEQLNYSSLNVPTWDSSAYYPPIETASGAYYCNYWNEYEYSYAPVYYGFQHYPELYQPFVPNVYGGLQNDHQTAYFDIYGYPVPEHFVPVVYYPVYYVPVTSVSIDVPSQYHDEYDSSYANDCQHTTSENSFGILTNFSAHEEVSAEETTLEMYYEEDGERLNDAPFNNDDKKDIDDNKSTSCHSESKCKEESCLEFVDSDYEDEVLELCSKFEKLSLVDNEEKSSSSNSDDNSVEYFSSNSDDDSSEDSSSSGSYEVNDTAVKRQGNNMDLHQIDDYTQSGDFDTSPSSGVKKIITIENSEVERETHELSGQSYIDMIVSSEEFLGVQDNLEHPKLYKDYLYRKSLKNNPRREKNILFDVLPTIEEESTPLTDDTPIEPEDEINIQDRMTVSNEMISSIKEEPVISKMKRRKGRFHSFRKWLSRKLCCCCATKDPP